MLYDKIKAYAKSGVYPFHMPGHKRQIHDDLLPYDIDLTEIDGFDNLHHPNGCIRDIEQKAAQLFGVKRAFVLVNGATGGILAAVRSMTKPGDTVLLARNCHRAVYHAAELCGLNAEYIYPQTLNGYPMIYGSITEADVYSALEAHPDTKLVIITSPTYEGIGSDMALIAEQCYLHGAQLFVDEAHGAHRYFDRKTVTAMAGGADASVVSLHKTLPSLTQTALLLTNNESLIAALQDNLAVFESSSPSYVLMSSVEQCLDYILAHSQQFERYEQRLELFYKRTKELKHLRLLYHHLPDDVFDFDRGKLVILTAGTNLSGYQLADALRKQYQLEIEMAAGDYVIAMSTVCDTDEGFTRLENALFAVDKDCISAEKPLAKDIKTIVLQKAYASGDCYRHASAVTALSETAGKVSHEDVFAYPPGIPMVVKGEIITGEILSAIQALEQGGANIISSRNTYPNGLIVSDL